MRVVTRWLSSKQVPEQLQPWHRQLGETPRQYEAFRLYLDGLTQLQVANKLYERVGSESKPLYKKPPGQIAKWASENSWVQRRSAYADHLNLVRDEAVESQQKSQAVDWARRRADLDEELLALSEAMVAKAQEMISYPLTRDAGTTVEWHDEEKKYPKTVHVFGPARWTFNSACSLLTVAKDVADEVARRRIADQDGRVDQQGDLERRLLESLEKLEKCETSSVN